MLPGRARAPRAAPGRFVRGSMATDLSPAEAFLVAFHDARPGLTAKAFGALPVACGSGAFASSYDALAELVPMAAPRLAVLDLACGDGYLLAMLAARARGNLALTGIDMSAAELAAARNRLGTTATLREAKAQALPFRTGTFDCVVCHMALMLMDDLGRVLDEVRRVLKPRSPFVAVIGAQSPPSAARSAFVDALLRRPRLPHLADVRLGDRRLRSLEGILEAMAPAFSGVAVDDLELAHRLSPDELWDWFLDMYDLHFLNESDRDLVRNDYLAALAPHRDADGRLAFPQRLRRVYGIAT